MNVGIYTGVPDSLLKNFCDYLYGVYGISKQHMICANEGNCIAFGVGAYLSSKKIPCIYMQNSGIGNAVNPLLSLSSPEVYKIPLVLLIGWRGAPGEKDEPQHVSQGKRTPQMLELMDIPYCIIDANSGISDICGEIGKLNKFLSEGQSIAFLVRKNAFAEDLKYRYYPASITNCTHPERPIREKAMRRIIERYQNDLFIATTGFTSRELFEIRAGLGQGHSQDFLTIGSMGHSSTIALGLALHRDTERVWRLDGDGAALMHMGAMAIIGASGAKQLIHVLFNNEAHESVGGLPTVGGSVNFAKIAEACGYKEAFCIESEENLDEIFPAIDAARHSIFIEIKIKIGLHADLGRPNIKPEVGKDIFMLRVRDGSKS
jgi:phosphonopyruvate decarboxylase